MPHHTAVPFDLFCNDPPRNPSHHPCGGQIPKQDFEMTKKATKKAAKKIAKRRTRAKYTKADVKELRAHSKARTPVSKIVKAMKRSEGSLRQKALNLGIGLGHRR